MDKKILARLKTKAASFGFNVDELKGIAAVIAGNLDSEKEATDEDIDAQIDAVLPILKVGQQQAQRIAKSVKTTTEAGDEEKDTSATDKNQKNTEEKNDGEQEVLRMLREMKEEIASLKIEKTTSTRRAKLETMLKDTGKFGERILKNFSRMKFEKDEDFDEFLTDVETDLEEFKQEQGDENLQTVTKPPGGGDGKVKKEKPLTDDEIKRLVDGIV